MRGEGLDEDVETRSNVIEEVSMPILTCQEACTFSISPTRANVFRYKYLSVIERLNIFVIKS